MSKKVAEIVTEQIIEQMSKGVIPWAQPWTIIDSGCINYVTRKPYSLINCMLLGKSGEYMTFNQAAELGGKVKKGAKSKIVIFYKPLTTSADDDDDSDDDSRPNVVLRYYRVFSLDDIEGIASKLPPTEPRPVYTNEACDNVINNYLHASGVTLDNSGNNSASYNPATDTVTVPAPSQFADGKLYYNTVYHELGHSTGHPTRLARIGGNSKAAAKGGKDYGREELVAEMTAAILCAHTGISSADTIADSAAYLQGWINALKGDSNLILYAAAKAEKAVKFILDSPPAAATATTVVTTTVAEPEPDDKTQDFLQAFREIYEKLYDGRKPKDYDKAIAMFDRLTVVHPYIIAKYAKARGDYFSSDIEAAAFVYAARRTGILPEITAHFTSGGNMTIIPAEYFPARQSTCRKLAATLKADRLANNALGDLSTYLTRAIDKAAGKNEDLRAKYLVNLAVIDPAAAEKYDKPLKFTKSIYYIMCYDGDAKKHAARKYTGYTDGKYYYCKEGDIWTATEPQTGLKITDGKTRADAAAQAHKQDARVAQVIAACPQAVTEFAALTAAAEAAEA